MERTFNECLNMGVEMDGIIDLYEVIAHESGRDDQEPAFFYHSDHLGSAAYLTNDAGQVTQTLNYLPYGEDWVDIQNYVETRYPRLGIYTYNGKEKDYESGFHYYGARYYWSELLTGWLSVDPMMDKYPGISPYAYCAWTPVMYIDPDGSIIRDRNGKIKYYSDGTLVRATHPSGSTAILERGYIYANDGTQIEVLKNIGYASDGWNTNCHGTTFADGEYWLNNEQVPLLLNSDGYTIVKQEEAQSGDAILYLGNDGSTEIEHSMTIVSTDGTLEGTQVAGLGGLETETKTVNASSGWKNADNSVVVRKTEPDVIQAE